MAHAPPPPDAETSARSQVVLESLRSAAGPSGFLPFDRFMEIALYEPLAGYYERARSPLGTEGDFYTAGQVHPIFAASLAARIRTLRAALAGSRPFLIVELGPGDGTLAAGVVSALAADAPGVEYVLVDRASARIREAEERVRAAGSRIPVRRSDSIAAIGPFEGVVVANEFLDAQPARRLRWHDGAWHETGIVVEHGRAANAEEPLTRSVPGAPLPDPPASELIFEFSPTAEATIREVGDHLARGAAIFLDFGSTEPELVRGHSAGTLAAVRWHRFLSDPLEAPGSADLSTFVNFSRMRYAAVASGLVEVAFRSQAEALGAWGFPALLDGALRSAASSEAKVRLQLAAKNLLFGFDRFRVLELAPPVAGSARSPLT